MRTLLEIADDMVAFYAAVEAAVDEGGEIAPEAEAALDAWFAELSQDRDKKVDAYAALIREWTLRAAARREEMERLAKRVKADENAAKRLKERLKFFMESQGLDKIETKRFRVSVAKNGGKLPLELTVRPEQLPMDFQLSQVIVDEQRLRKALEDGREVPGAKLGERGTHLRIS
jgi:hypothetical protein